MSVSGIFSDDAVSVVIDTLSTQMSTHTLAYFHHHHQRYLLPPGTGNMEAGRSVTIFGHFLFLFRSLSHTSSQQLPNPIVLPQLLSAHSHCRLTVVVPICLVGENGR